MKIFQIVRGFCHKDITALSKTTDLKAITALQWAEAPDYVFAGWGFDSTKEGDARFIKPDPPEGWLYDDATGTFYQEGSEMPSGKKLHDEISKACNATIIAGIDIGESHYSLTETDQINLSTAMTAIQQGAASYPYHADGELCRMYSAEEITAIAAAATQHKLYHTTYCNHLFAWIRRCTTQEELKEIYYGAELPEDLAANMAEVLDNASTAMV